MTNPKLKKLEALTLDYLKKRPFHNLFILHEIDIKDSKLGGICSDLTLEFKEILLENGFEVTLHCSLVDGVEIHKLLKVQIDGKEYEEFFLIPFVSKSEEEILKKIENRFVDKETYPFDGKLIYSFIHEDTFYFIRGDKKFVYREEA